MPDFSRPRLYWALEVGPVASVSAQAVPILWTLDSVTFDDTGTASGSFVYEEFTNVFTMISVVTTAGTTLGGTSYSDNHFTFSQSNQPIFTSGPAVPVINDLTGETVLSLALSMDMTNAGGTIPISIGFGTAEGTCIDPSCTGAGIPRRFVTGGSITTVVPEPGTVGLLGAGLIGLVLRRRRAA